MPVDVPTPPGKTPAPKAKKGAKPGAAGKKAGTGLKKKVGGLPIWAWGVGIGGAILLGLYLRGKLGAGGASGTTAAAPTDQGSGGGGGGVPPFTPDTTVTPAPLPPDLLGAGFWPSQIWSPDSTAAVQASADNNFPNFNFPQPDPNLIAAIPPSLNLHDPTVRAAVAQSINRSSAGIKSMSNPGALKIITAPPPKLAPVHRTAASHPAVQNSIRNQAPVEHGRTIVPPRAGYNPPPPRPPVGPSGPHYAGGGNRYAI